MAVTSILDLTRRINIVVDELEKIRLAIVSKNVPLPASSKIQEFAPAIMQIQSGEGKPLPQLHTLSIKRQDNNLIITNPSNNGDFVKSYALYTNDYVVNTTTSTNIDIRRYYPNGLHKITVRAKNPNFIDSQASNNIDVSVYEIRQKLVGLNGNNSENKTTDGLTYNLTISPQTGKFLPEFIDVYQDTLLRNKEYNSYTGEIVIDDIQGHIDIEATAWDVQKLRTPSISIDELATELIVTRPKYALNVDIYLDDTIIREEVYEKPAFDVENLPNVTYGFEEDGDYYQSTNYHRGGSFAYCKLNFEIKKPTGSLILSCISNGESGYDYGLISNVDKDLSLSANSDGSTGSALVKHNFQNQSSTTPQIITYDNISQGKHYITIKYRKDGGGDQALDRFKFQVVEIG